MRKLKWKESRWFLRHRHTVPGSGANLPLPGWRQVLVDDLKGAASVPVFKFTKRPSVHCPHLTQHIAESLVSELVVLEYRLNSEAE